MKPAPFHLHRPRSIDEALGFLQSYRDDTKVLAGGQSLVPLMNFRLAQPRHLIDLNGVQELDKIAIDDQILSLGAMVRQRDVERSNAIAERLPILSEAIEQIAHPAVRNRGTIGGSLVHADPAAELPLLAVALDATFHLRSAHADRSVAARDFYRGYLLTDIAPDELLVGADFRLPPAASGWCFSEVARRRGDFAIVAVAVVLSLDSNRRIAFARLALGGVGPAPLRVEAAEEALVGERPGAELYRRVAEIAAQAVEAPSDIHASSAYRRHIAGVLVRRALGVAESRVATRRGPGHLAKEERENSPAASSREHHFSPRPGEKISIAVAVNGVRYTASVEPRRSLVDFLRHDLGLVGTHIGCEHGVCGACTVMLGGRTVRSCLLFAAQADGMEIVTIEGMSADGALHPLQLAFRQNHAVQCGFCTPGMILAALELLRDHADPTEEEIRVGLGGNVCMCTGYVNIVRAVRAAANEASAR